MDKQFVANKNYILREIAGEAVLVSVGAGVADFCGIINLNSSAKVLWNTLQQPVTEEEMVVSLKEKFFVEDDVAREDVKHTLQILEGRGMISNV